MSWLISFEWAYYNCKDRESSELQNVKFLPPVEFEAGTSRLQSEPATTELRRLFWIVKVYRVLPECPIFRNLSVARGRWSKIRFCKLFTVSKRLNWSNSKTIQLLWQKYTTNYFATSTMCCRQISKNSTGKTRLTFIHSTHSFVSGRSRVWIPQLEKIFDFVILARLELLRALGNPCKWNQPWHTPC